MQRSLFHDRLEAGQRLASALLRLKPFHPVVLALPRGGVPVAAPVADALEAPLDLLLVRKLALREYPELAIGAVADGGHPRTIINWSIVRSVHIEEPQIAEIASSELAEIERRRKTWLDGRPSPDLKGRAVVVVDDGVATGASTRVALAMLRATGGARRIVLAAPVAPPDAADALARECDETVFLATPEGFRAVGDFYDDFHQLDDEEVHDILAQHRTGADLAVQRDGTPARLR